MICTKLWARLGNQCFQIAAAVAHAKKMNTTWGAPRKSLDPRVWPTYFQTPRDRATLHYYKEKRHCYDPLPMENDLTIEGYFQSEKYFYNAKLEVAGALGFKYEPNTFCSIHVRRGDYLLYPTQFPVLPSEYYEKAIDKMLSMGWDKFVVHSDDIPWCKKFFHGYNFAYSPFKDPVQDMKAIYNAGAFIIGNSSFSLFPALLRDGHPIVIAPSEDRWYGPDNKHLETCDLMPERFIKI